MTGAFSLETSKEKDATGRGMGVGLGVGVAIGGGVGVAVGVGEAVGVGVFVGGCAGVGMAAVVGALAAVGARVTEAAAVGSVVGVGVGPPQATPIITRRGSRVKITSRPIGYTSFAYLQSYPSNPPLHIPQYGWHYTLPPLRRRAFSMAS